MKIKTENAVKKVVDSYEKGVYTRSEMYHFVERMIHDNDIDEIISSLPEVYRQEFVDYLSQTFGNREITDEGFLFLHDIKKVSLKVTLAIRTWLDNKRKNSDTKD